jgi:hypothetical protein
MVGTYLELQTRVQTRLIDLPTAVQAEVPQLVNEALYELQSRHNFKVMERELFTYTQVFNRTLQTGTPSTAQSPLFTWPQSSTIAPQVTPSTLKEWRGRAIYVLYSDGTPRFVNVTAQRTDIYSAYTEWDPSFPSVILDSIPSDNANDRTLEVYPLPDGLSDWPDGEYRLLLPYYGFLPALSANSDSNWLTTNPHGERFIIAAATAEGFALDWDTQNEQKWKAKSELEYKYCVMQDKKYRLGEVNELAIHSRGQYASRIRN